MILTTNEEENLECIVDSRDIVRFRNIANKRFARGYLYRLKQFTIYNVKPAERETGVSVDFHIDFFELMYTKMRKFSQILESPRDCDSREVSTMILREIKNFIMEFVGYGVYATVGRDFPEPPEWSCSRVVHYEIKEIKKAKISFFDKRGSRTFSLISELKDHLKFMQL